MIDCRRRERASRAPARDRSRPNRSSQASSASIAPGSPSASIASCARGAVDQIAFGPAFAQPQAERRHIVDQPPLAARFRLASNVASVRRASSASRPALDRPEPGAIPASAGKAASKVWAKLWMVWIRRPPPGRFEHLGEQASGALDASAGHCPRRGRTAPCSAASRQSHPMRQPLADAVGHFRRARLGEGQAQDRRGGVPRSSSRSTRDVSTWVLPVPAEADSAA